MATIVGGIGTTHVPSIGKAIAEKKQNDPYWRPFFKGFDYVHYWLARTKPDVAVVFYNDHGLNFFLDKLPTFAVGASAEYRSEDEGWGIPVSRPVPGDADMSWRLINTLVADEFDVAMCQDMLIDHAVTIPMALMWPSAASSDRPWPVKIVPVEINTVQHPLPSMARCLKLGRSIGRALETYPRDLRVAIVGTGGLSHQLDGTRAGFVNKEFDALCLDKIVAELEALTRYSIHELVELSGSQGVEFLNWMAMRGALTGRVSELDHNYHIPVSNWRQRRSFTTTRQRLNTRRRKARLRSNRAQPTISRSTQSDDRAGSGV
jgi:protocatechuate 4,5-dioxygenase beta chain